MGVDSKPLRISGFDILSKITGVPALVRHLLHSVIALSLQATDAPPEKHASPFYSYRARAPAQTSPSAGATCSFTSQRLLIAPHSLLAKIILHVSIIEGQAAASRSHPTLAGVAELLNFSVSARSTSRADAQAPLRHDHFRLRDGCDLQLAAIQGRPRPQGVYYLCGFWG